MELLSIKLASQHGVLGAAGSAKALGEILCIRVPAHCLLRRGWRVRQVFRVGGVLCLHNVREALAWKAFD